MKFSIKQTSESSKARIGSLYGAERLPDFVTETPLLMLYTKGGSIPHITHEVLQLITKEAQTIQIPLVSTVQFAQPMGEYNRPIADFVGLTENLTCVTVQDPGDVTPTGKHKLDSVPIWTKSGKVEITSDMYMDMVETFKPDFYYTLSDGDTNLTSSKKRTSKSVDRTIQFFKNCVQRHAKSDILKNKLMLAGIAGGFSIRERERCLKSFEEHAEYIGGYLIDGLHNNGPELEFMKFDEVKPILEESIELLPKEKLRAIHGCWNPLVLIQLVMSGIDIFDSSFPFIVTERSAALTFNFNVNTEITSAFEINLRDSKFSSCFESLCPNCKCLACRKHTTAYIYHLLNVQELLGNVLLTIHNLHHYLEFFKNIRKAISNNSILELHDWIKGQYEKYQNCLLETPVGTPAGSLQSDFQEGGDSIRRLGITN